MDINVLLKIMQNLTGTRGMFLISALTDKSGFFSMDGKLTYVVKDDFNYISEGIDTDYLLLRTHLRISAVENNPTFRDDDYNIIVFKGDVNNPNIEAFIRLCTVHSQHARELNFREFFYSLIDLFQLPADQKFKNALGLYGELKFIEYMQDKYCTDISSTWHKSGPFSAYDFTNGTEGVEVKSTLSDEPKVLIKHAQIFGKRKCYLVVVCCDKDDCGETINDVVKRMYNRQDCYNSFEFALNLQKELNRISEIDREVLKFVVADISVYDATMINPFPNVPINISELTYKFDTTLVDVISENEFNKLIESFRLS